MSFELSAGLARKDFVCDLPFCRVLLEDNADFPWIILVPRKADTKNMCALTTDERLILMREIEVCEKAMVELFHPTQTNVAMIGCKTVQLHVHIICRYKGDMYWPDTIWDRPSRTYISLIKDATIEKIKKEIQNQCQKLQYSFRPV